MKPARSYIASAEQAHNQGAENRKPKKRKEKEEQKKPIFLKNLQKKGCL